MIRRVPLSLVAYVFFLGTLGQARAGSITLSDGTFANSDWQVTTFQTLSGGTVTGTQRATEGDPDSYRRVTDVVGPTPGSTVYGFHILISVTYSPMTQGGILAGSFSIDTKMFSGFGQGEGTFVALEQNGLFYTDVRDVFFANQANWTTQSLPLFTQNDFSQVFQDAGPAVVTDLNAHPDFSGAGTPIHFGFLTENHTAKVGYTIVSGFDNWTVNITPTPEPGSLTLLGIGAASLIALAWRRRMLAAA